LAKHHAFWEALGRGPNFQGVVTTNYDLTIERSLRDSPTHPACHYGGLKRPHYAIRRSELPGPPGPPTFELKGEIPLFKLHGSLNWHLLRSGKIEIYQDCRKAFAFGNTAAIVAPVAEKKPLEAFEPVWAGAEELLSRAETWLVIGYSLPPYDDAIRKMLGRAARHRPRIVVMDPSG
jgi:hypothetical protein